MSQQRIVILGAGESGVGAALLAKAKGFDVFVSDFGKISAKYRDILINNSIPFEEEKHTEELILNAKEVIKSPGIADKSLIVKKLLAQKTPVISEIEFAGRYTNAKKICITGTNGKTTTTLLIYHILKEAGLSVGLAGNIGDSFAKSVLESKKDIYVLELSSFQLDGMFDFKADIGIITNITPDHLDRYDYKVENYVASKFRILQNMDETSTFIYGIDSELLENELVELDILAEELPFSIYPDEFDGACGDETGITVQINEEELFIDTSNSTLKGQHNLYNTMAAVLVAAKLGIRKEVIEKALNSFKNAPHRLELVAEINGISFINDSKATNIDSTWYALDAYKNPIVWIAGGVDKGNDYAVLTDLVKSKVKALICLTKDDDKLKKAFNGIIPVIRSTLNVDEAANWALELASKEDIVLLSPACASFDLFKNYEDRGEKFKTAVLNLKLNK